MLLSVTYGLYFVLLGYIAWDDHRRKAGRSAV